MKYSNGSNELFWFGFLTGAVAFMFSLFVWAFILARLNW
jgi:hypothetical protein